MDNQTRRDPEALSSYLAGTGIDSIETTPSFAKVLLAGGLFDQDSHPSVVALGGEAVDPPLWSALAEKDGLVAYNFYGPTETTVDSLTAVMQPGTEPTLGDSVANSRHYILDSGLNPVPVNAIGELYVAGINLARGYLDQPGLSAERFVADPFVPDGSRMYRTGDVVRRLPDGTLEFRGRMDAQVKIRGFRIELAEIEEVLRGLDGVEHAAVAVTKNRAGYDQLLGYVTAAGPDGAGCRPMDTAELDTAELRQQARRQLPGLHGARRRAADRGHPADRQRQAGHPRASRAGDGNRRHRAPQRTGTDRGRGLQGSPGARRRRDWTTTSSNSAATPCWPPGWWPCCGTGPASRPALRTVFEQATVAALAETLELGAGNANPLGPVERPAVIPLSFAQRRLWFLNRFDPGSGAYNIPVVLELKGTLDVAALRGAINQVADRHESLRTVFPLVDGEPVAADPVRAPGGAAGRPVHRRRRWPAPSRLKPGAASTSPGNCRCAPSCSSWPRTTMCWPLHCTILPRTAGPWPRSRRISHSPTTPWRPARTPRWRRFPCSTPTTRCGSATNWAARTIPASAISRQLEFWTRELRGAPEELRLPFDFSRGAQGAAEPASSVPLTISPETSARLNALAREHNASLFMVLQAALAALLTKSGAGEDIPLGTPVAGRTDTQLNELVGFFVNTLVLRTNTSGNPTAAELVESVRYTNLHAYANQDAPFERVVEELNPARSQHRHPLFQVMLTLQNTAAAGLVHGRSRSHRGPQPGTGRGQVRPAAGPC